MSATIYDAIKFPTLDWSMQAYAASLPYRYENDGTYKFSQWQLDDWIFAWNNIKCCIVRSRGGSKTNDFVDWLVYRVLRTKEDWAWLSVKSGQLDQAKKYLLANPYVIEIKSLDKNKFDVILANNCSFRLGIISNSNLGMRLDGIIYDEFEDAYEPQTMEAYAQMPGMLTKSKIHKQIYIGTLWINRLFNDYTHQLPTTIRPWFTIPHLVAAGMIEAEIEEGITPDWQIKLQYDCIEATPHGLVFENINEMDYSLTPPPNEIQNQFGADFGGTDHVISVKVDDANRRIYIMEELELDLLKEPDRLDGLRGYKFEAEIGGYNSDPKNGSKGNLLKIRIGASTIPVTNKWKSERVAMAKQYELCIDRKKTPHLYTDIKSAERGIEEPYIKDTLHPCHWLDAFLHAIGANKHQYFEPTPTAAQNAYIKKKEALRDREYRRSLFA